MSVQFHVMCCGFNLALCFLSSFTSGPQQTCTLRKRVSSHMYCICTHTVYMYMYVLSYVHVCMYVYVMYMYVCIC